MAMAPQFDMGLSVADAFILSSSSLSESELVFISKVIFIFEGGPYFDVVIMS